jgi:hypothetical protein
MYENIRTVIRPWVEERTNAVANSQVGSTCDSGFAIYLLPGGHLLRVGLFPAAARAERRLRAPGQHPEAPEGFGG